jgi:hypothetical protein
MSMVACVCFVEGAKGLCVGERDAAGGEKGAARREKKIKGKETIDGRKGEGGRQI